MLPLYSHGVIPGNIRPQLYFTSAKKPALFLFESRSFSEQVCYSRFRWIFPEMVFGSSSRKTIFRGYL